MYGLELKDLPRFLIMNVSDTQQTKLYEYTHTHNYVYIHICIYFQIHMNEADIRTRIKKYKIINFLYPKSEAKSQNL